MSECPHCGATDDPEYGVIVSAVGDGTSSCTVCRADDLAERTVLSDREAEVAAHKQLTGASHATIAERLNLGKTTIDEYSRRMRSKVRAAKVTQNELGEFL